MGFGRAALCAIAALLPTGAQDTAASEPKERIRAARALRNQGSESIPKLRAMLTDPVPAVRIEVVKVIIEIGSQHSLDPLVQATRDHDEEVQVRATDGLVNFYYPGYVQNGLSSRIRRAGNSVVAQFTDTNDQVIDPHITVRPEVIDAIGKLARGGSGMAVRANAARAVGILRGQAASDDLIEALKSKDDAVMYEVLVALQKIGDQANGPRIAFLLRDLSDRVQIAALETTGVLRNMEAAPRVREVLEQPRNIKIRRAALTTLAMLADPSNRPIYAHYLADKDDALRAAAAEGFGRLADPADQPRMEQAFSEERKTGPRLSMAFAVVAAGNTALSESSPLQYLVSTANQRMYRDVAQVFLIELARNEKVRQALYPAMASGTRNEKIVLARALAASGGTDAIPYLEALTKDTDSEAAQEGFRALRNLRARLG